MDYIIRNKNSQFYIPRIPFWVMDDLKLKGIDAQLYALILSKGFLVWTSSYIAAVLRCSSKTILRSIEKLDKLETIEKKFLIHEGRRRCVLVSLYTENGKRSAREVKDLIDAGIEKLNKLYFE